MKSEGVFYGVGLGPGDPELITVAGARVLRQADGIFHPASMGSDQSVSLAILGALNIPPEKVEAVSLCMGRDRTQSLAAYREASQRIADRVGCGESVAFICEGDPFFYGTFIYLYEALRLHHPDVPVKIIPGISSVFYAAGKAGKPTARQDERVAILPSLASEEELERMMEQFDTVFLLKLTRSYATAYSYLQRKGMLGHAVYLEKIGTPQERIERDLTRVDAKDLRYFSMLMIRKS